MEMINLEQIRIEKELASLYEIDKGISGNIKKDMEKNGFRKSHPLIVWKRNSSDYVLVDGHTRLQVAKELKIKNVPAEMVTLSSMEEAVRHGHKEQNHRRNLSNADLVKRFMYYREIGVDGPGREADKIASILSISFGQSRKIIYLLNNSTPKDKKRLLTGEITINALYNILHEKKLLSKKNAEKEGKLENTNVQGKEAISEKTMLRKSKNEKTVFDSFVQKIRNQFEKLPDIEEPKKLEYFDILTGKSKKYVVLIKWDNGEESKIDMWSRTEDDILKQFDKSNVNVEIKTS